jgi:ionotropic glutamate receptor NMDA 2B
VPPQGVPDKFHLTVGFLDEPAFVNLDPPDPVSGRCNVDRGVPCRVHAIATSAAAPAATEHDELRVVDDTAER